MALAATHRVLIQNDRPPEVDQRIAQSVLQHEQLPAVAVDVGVRIVRCHSRIEILERLRNTR